MEIKFFVCVLIFIFAISGVFAIGITPGRTTVNFEPRLSKEVSFSIINTEHKDMNVVFFVRGDINENILLKQTYATLSASENSKTFNYNINLPEKFDKPGLYQGEIVAQEIPKNKEEEGTFVGGSVAVITQIYVYVPYPDKYLDGEVNVIEAVEGGKTLFLISLINRGKLDVVNAKAIIDIYTALNEKVATIETESESLASLERTELSADWNPSVNPGKYLAYVSVVYDEKVLSLEKQFNVGSLIIEIRELSVGNFQLGEIAKFTALVENKWSSSLKDVFLNIIVYNNQNEIMADFKSPNYDIEALSQSQMIAYWDTAGVPRGDYDGKLVLRYESKSVERNIQLKISESKIEITGITGQVLVRGKSGESSTSFLIILLIGILVLANIIWFVVVKRILKRKR